MSWSNKCRVNLHVIVTVHNSGYTNKIHLGSGETNRHFNKKLRSGARRINPNDTSKNMSNSKSYQQ